MQLENLVKPFRNATLATAMLYAPTTAYSQLPVRQTINSNTTITFSDNAPKQTPAKSHSPQKPHVKSHKSAHKISNAKKPDYTIYSASRDCNTNIVHEKFYGKLESLELTIGNEKIRGTIKGNEALYQLPNSLGKSELYGKVVGYAHGKPVVSSLVTIKDCGGKPVYAPKPVAPQKALPPIEITKENRNFYVTGLPNQAKPVVVVQTIKSKTDVKNAVPGQKVVVKEKNENFYVQVAPRAAPQPDIPNLKIQPPREFPREPPYVPPPLESPRGFGPYNSLTLQLGGLTDTFAAISIDATGKKTVFPSDSYTGSQIGLEYGYFGKNSMFKANFASTKAKDSLAPSETYCYTQQIEGTSYAIEYTGKIPFGKNSKFGVVLGGSIEAKNLRTSYGNIFDQEGITTSINNNTEAGLKAGLGYGHFYGNYVVGGVKAFQQTINENYLLDTSNNAAASHTEKGTGIFFDTRFFIPETRAFVEARYDSGKVKTENSTNGKYLAAADYNNSKVFLGYLGASGKWHAGFGIASAQNNEEWKDSINKLISASTKHSGSKYFFQAGLRW